MFRRKLKSGDRVMCHVTWYNEKHVDYWLHGTIQNLLPNPFLPDWITHPNYLVLLDVPEKPNCPDVFTRKELKLIKP